MSEKFKIGDKSYLINKPNVGKSDVTKAIEILEIIISPENIDVANIKGLTKAEAQQIFNEWLEKKE